MRTGERLVEPGHAFGIRRRRGLRSGVQVGTDGSGGTAVGGEMVQPGVGERLPGARIVGQLGYGRLGERVTDVAREPRRHDAPPEDAELFRVGSDGNTAEQRQDEGQGIVVRDFVESLERCPAPPQVLQLLFHVAEVVGQDVTGRCSVDCGSGRGGQPEPQCPQALHQAQPVKCVLAVAPVAATAATGLGQDTALGVETDGLHGHTRGSREVAHAPDRFTFL
ncbi:hypothetical protein AQJ66_24595 [Streptomyces bungoensis]|uniref:Uncharacterized protein n=1 Tax=Streptomyces bungoensis TaxID=285568 RepID=A0A101SVV2_9ACTN|nr:hypothetical protein AQJ66_24595 [Streptomyces bungoensis]